MKLIEKCEKCAGCSGTEKVCSNTAQTCAGCSGDVNRGCTSCQGAEKGCAGGCPHAAGYELEWDYDDTVLVYSSDMLEESP